MMDNIKDKKAALRTEIRKARRGLDRAARSERDAAITNGVLSLEEYKSASVIFCFVSYGGEPETREIIKRALKDGRRVAVPRCVGDGVMECVIIDSLDGLIKSKMGIMEPAAGMPVIGFDEIDFAVVPGLAFSRDGSRLGQGGGYYDRFMAETHAFTCGICYSDFIVENIPCEDFDMRVKAVITDKNIIINY